MEVRFFSMLRSLLAIFPLNSLPRLDVVPMPVLLLLLFLAQPVTAAQPDMFSFAQSLAREADHYRAITEYKRFLHYFPDDPRAAKAQLAIAESFFAGERWEAGDAAAAKVWQNYPGTEDALQARMLYAEAAFKRKDYAAARERYRNLQEFSAALAAQSKQQIGWAYVEEGRLSEAEQSFAQLAEPQASELEQFLLDYRQLPRKSPQLAGTLSALLPGAGQLYTERPKQAGVAFALNAAFIYGAIEAWNNENYTVAGILSLFEIGWYGGNIYNAMNNAHKINRTRETEFKQQWQRRGSFSLGLHEHYPWLQARFTF